MHFNNLRCRRAQLLSNNVYLPEQSKYLRYIQLSDNEALHRHSTYRGPRVDRIPP